MSGASRQTPSTAPILGFALRFAGIFALVLALTIRFYEPLAWLSVAWARVLSALLNVTGMGPATSDGRFVHFGAHTLEVVLECTGVHLMGMWLGVVLAFPAGWWQRLVGLLAGAVVISTANAMRLWMAAWVLDRWPHRFDFIHTYVWQTTIIVLLLGLGAWWMRFCTTSTARPR